MNLAPMEVMANPAEQGASGFVEPSTPVPAAFKPASGIFRSLLAQYAQAFALVKRLGTRSEAQLRQGLESYCDLRPVAAAAVVGAPVVADERAEMLQGYTALQEIFRSQILPESEPEARAGELADAMAALEAINPGSPEWGPTFLQVSELVEAHADREDDESVARADERCQQHAAC
jgi:hypothetical protein